MLIFDQLKKGDPQLRLLTLVVLGGMLILLAGLWWVQIVSYRSYQAHLETQTYRSVRIPAARGKILDRNGVALVENRPTYDVSLYFEDLRDQFKDAYTRLRPARVVTNSLPFWKRWLGFSTVTTQSVRLNKSQLETVEWQARYDVASHVIQQVGAAMQTTISLDLEKFKRHYMTRLALPYPVLSDLNATQIARFEEQPDLSASVDMDVQPERYYPYQTTAAHILGYLQRDDQSRKGEEAYFSYRLPDYRGVVGIEYGFDAQLRGQAGAKSVLVNNLGYRQTESVWSPAEPGENVVLTIDLYLQQAAEKALHRFGPDVRGAVVVMNVNTGDILAMVSSPALNPNDFVQGISRSEAAYLNDPTLMPQINRATQANYAPGSIFKPVVALACLKAGLDPDAEIDNPGYIYVGRRHINDLAPPGEYNLKRAIMYSCNTYFITNGMKAGAEAIVKMGEKFHFGQLIGLQTRQETAGYFPTLKRVRSGWYDGDTANLCIGQGSIAVTPLQMAVMTCALANGGKVLWPRLVERIEPQDPTTGQPAEVFPAGRLRDELGVNPHFLQIIKNAMRAEVLEGTGRAAQVPGMELCGKTGTAEVTDVHNNKIGKNTWFISFAPYNAPRYAVVVLVESGEFGGSTCAPVAHDIYEAIQKREAGETGTLAQAN